MNLIIAFLAPMFLAVSAGNVGFARLAAMETLNAYRARNQMDLVAVAQIIAFGLTALGSLSLSMADNLSLSMTLRLRGNAVALNRAGEQTRRALDKRRDASTAPSEADIPDEREAPEGLTQAELESMVAATKAHVMETQDLMQFPQPAPQPAEPLAATPIPTATPPATQPAPADAIAMPRVAPPPEAIRPTGMQRNQAAWAAAMADVAAKMTSGIVNLPPAQRKVASLKAEALASTANMLLSNLSAPTPAIPTINGIARSNRPPPHR